MAWRAANSEVCRRTGKAHIWHDDSPRVYLPGIKNFKGWGPLEGVAVALQGQIFFLTQNNA